MQILISNTDVTKKVSLDNLIIENILTRQVDRCSFNIKSIQNYTPTVGAEVIIYDNSLNKIFGGLITKISEIGEEYKIILIVLITLDYLIEN